LSGSGHLAAERESNITEYSGQPHPLTLFTRTFEIAPSLPIMATPPPNLMDAWRTWNAYHRHILREFPQDFAGKVAIRTFRKKISDDWKELSKLHPNDHGVRKLQFHRRAKALDGARNTEREAVTSLQALDAPNVADRHATEAEVLLAARIQVLRELESLIDLERMVMGQPADRIRHYDERRVNAFQLEIRAAERQVRVARILYESDTDSDDNPPPRRKESRTGYQQELQERNVGSHSGGDMYHIHLSTSAQSSVGVWVLCGAHNTIVDRVVVKDCWFIQAYPRWTDTEWWIGDPTTMQPSEALIHRKLHHESILRLRSWHMHAHKLMFRVGPCIDPPSTIFAQRLNEL
jgi:hypothetical protein